jgi:hypothetical protein
MRFSTTLEDLHLDLPPLQNTTNHWKTALVFARLESDLGANMEEAKC